MSGRDNQAYSSESDDQIYENHEILEEERSKQRPPLPTPRVTFIEEDPVSTGGSGSKLSDVRVKGKGLWDQEDRSSQSDSSEDDSEWNGHHVLDYDLPISDTTSDHGSNACEKCFSKCQALIKIIFAMLLGAVVLGCVLISKGALLFTASQMHRYVGFKRTAMLSNNDSCTDPEDCRQCGVPVCIDEDNPECTQKESVRWIWGMFLIQCTPYMLMTLRCVWKICFKKKTSPSFTASVCVLTTETLHVIGTFILLFDILPFLDVYRGVLILSGVALIPSILNLLVKNKRENKVLKLILDVLGLLGQILAVFLVALITWTNNWTYTWDEVCGSNNTEYMSDVGNDTRAVFATGGPIVTTVTQRPIIRYNYVQTDVLPETAGNIWKLMIALILISLGYWENFVDDRVGFLYNLRQSVMKCNTKIHALAGLWKIILTFLLIMFHFGLTNQELDLKMIFATNNFYENKCGVSDGDIMDYFQSDWLVVAIIQIFVGIICFYTSNLAIKGQLQLPSFTVPLVCATPLMFLLFFWPCNDCDSSFDLGTPYYWNCNAGYKDAGSGISSQLSWIGLCLWWPAFILVTRYLWTPNIERLAKTEKVFWYPFPCGALLEQSLMLIRRRDDNEFKGGHGTSSRPSSMIQDTGDLKSKGREQEIFNTDNLQAPYVPTLKYKTKGNTFIYFCATMWHETAEEMLQILSSIFSMNNDQTRRQWVKDYGRLAEMDRDFYQFEVHIFFDDAFEADEEDDTKLLVNEYVKLFVRKVEEAACNVLEGRYDIGEPVKYDTPYGGRLEWIMPYGENKIIVHLKNKEKVRKGKRWSQIMYMHYILGQCIRSQKIRDRKIKDVELNTYILALDGDVDFKPEAVLMLLDLMKRNKKVAAACGRIHPLGSGPMVWYQKFEYSISHWLQKATEHILGCVLCSPGCFSLFRASALMDVAGTYGIIAEKPQHKVQYDQGEDRWLCTLLLQKGYRVEYSAASDAYTFAPEGFNEFFNQRRRWITSTFANLIDLLGTAMKTAKTNENISMLYMIYQGILFGSSILGPATIFLLIVGTIDFIVNSNQSNLAFVWILLIGITPFVFFMVLCFIGEKKTQLYFAGLFSTILAVIQILVLVGILSSIIENGLCSPTTIFFIIVVGTFILAACIHPQEFTNLLHLFVFYLFVPSTYLLLIIYSLCNINDVSWGTREAIASKSEKQQKDQKQHENAAKTSKSWTDHVWSSLTSSQDTGNSGCSLTCKPLFGCRCCITPGQSDTDKKFEETTKAIAVLGKEIIELKEEIQGHKNGDKADEVQVEIDPPSDKEEPSTSDAHTQKLKVKPRVWTSDFPAANLDPHEYSFWKKLVTSDDFLKPIEMTETQKEKMKAEMKELRNTCVFAFFLIDLLLIVLILSLKQTGITIQWECKGGTQSSNLDPIGLTFIIVFGFVLGLQLIGMVLHRLFTFLQLISNTVICKSQKQKEAEKKHNEINIENMKGDLKNMDQEDVLMIMRQVQRIDIEDDEDDSTSVTSRSSTLDQFPSDTRHKPHIRRKTRRTKVYNRQALNKEMAARLIALGKEVELNDATESTNEHSRKGKKSSQYHKAMRHMQQKKSFAINPNTLESLKKQHNIDDKDIQNKSKVLTSIIKKRDRHRMGHGRSVKFGNQLDPSLNSIKESSNTYEDTSI